MSFLKLLEKDLKELFNSSGYDIDKISICVSNRPDLGEYQVNDVMKIAKVRHQNPNEIALAIIEKLKEDKRFINVNVAGAGFINFSLSNEYIVGCMNKMIIDINSNIDIQDQKTIFLDYGGANVAKTLHVGHLRSANIGEALKRLAKLMGHEVISDVHLGDSGLQAGIVCLEMRNRYPDLICFSDDYKGEDFELPITEDDLSIIYPEGSKKAKADENIMASARSITLLIQQGDVCYNTLWNKISSLSIKQINGIYKTLNTTFELWEGERDSFVFVPEMLEYLNKKGLLYISEGATVMDVTEEADDKEIPPIILLKSDGAYLYGTTDLATIYSRQKRFNFDEIWYVVDNRQELHFTQVFRAAYKSQIINPEQKLSYLGFGTMNGKDGKPFKTRDGGSMSLLELIEIVQNEVSARLNSNISVEEKESIAHDLAIGAIKYADLLPFRSTDYIFEPSKFSDLDGKTGPYLVYSTIRMKSLLTKAGDKNFHMHAYYDEYDKEVMLNAMNLSIVLNKSYELKSVNDIAEYLFKLTSSYNKFYEHNRILSEENQQKKESWLALTSLVYQINMMLLNILGIKCPNKM